MTCGGRKVCRLSTVLSVSKPCTFFLTTEWLWYWKNDEDEWIEYGKGEDAQLRTPLTTEKLETIYQSDPQSEISVRQKEQMSKRNTGREVDERLLFHGTQESLIEAICEQNIDWRVCGVNGTVYGKGSYFARDASYSHQYSQSEDTTHKMFLARVLVGHYTAGNHAFVRPPPKLVGKGFYDSCGVRTDSLSEKMDDLISNHVLQVLCNNQGSLEFQQLNRILRQRLTVDERPLRRALLDNERFRVVDEDPTERALSPAALIIARTALRVCKDPAKCARCDELHLCRYLVCGKCRFGSKCKNSDDLKSAHNSVLLKKENLHFLKDAQLFQLLLQNDPSLLPEICLHYNKGNGEHGSCKFQAKCNSLHICQHYLQDDCKFGDTCKRAHNFDAKAIRILNGKGFNTEDIYTLQKTYKNKFLLTDQTDRSTSKRAEKDKQVKSQPPSSSSVSEVDRNEICLYFMLKRCSFKDKCFRVHHDLPYKWEILDRITWKQFPNEEDVERAYCNPDNNTSFGVLPVDFSLMKCGEKKVRRLSTASSVSRPPHFILTTEWLWYWKNDQGQWIEYGLGEDNKCLTPITSKALENACISEITEIPFSLGGNDYVLSTIGMHQQNQKYKTIREVRRRPRFVSAQDAIRKSKSDASETTNASSEEVPAYWDKAALPSFSYALVELSGSEPDYKGIITSFQRTMPLSTIHSVNRVQNPMLWRVFQWQKEQMKEKNNGKDILEHLLFHGTDKSKIEDICEQNFDWRICGVHGSMYGKGMYQRKKKYKTKQEVRRSPRFVLAQDTKRKLKSDASETSNASSEEVPAYWDKAALPSFSYALVELKLSGSEPDYKHVTTSFQRTMPLSTIHSVNRVQNPMLWRVFQWQKEQMKEKNNGKDILELLLFHGTDKSKIENICEENFDWRICGIHGSQLGKGTYFARDAMYSDKYSTTKSNTYMMFVARVLVGEFTKGCCTFVRPPQKPQNGGFYDSCVDDPSNPTIFVIFEKYQIYPEYVIEYS
ncbi:Poly [ADP-ribose] polymerase 12 [Bagarius yarrelli]|uniref:Poly [ADP-ribose] polymerase 12 n=1 Tax=Bagarius yarrelli TaxID=175774 RepID=A0A556TQV4_BAGYA|nr:Poly [ADP-ribose] polymerase 12 [Bagarius yarrelli]